MTQKEQIAGLNQEINSLKRQMAALTEERTMLTRTVGSLSETVEHLSKNLKSVRTDYRPLPAHAVPMEVTDTKYKPPNPGDMVEEDRNTVEGLYADQYGNDMADVPV